MTGVFKGGSLSVIATSESTRLTADVLKLRFVAVQKLREKKLISEEGTLEIVTKITREQTGKNVSFNTHASQLDGESLASQV